MKNMLWVKGLVMGVVLWVAGISGTLTLGYAQEKAALVPMDLDGTQWAIDVVSVNKKGQKETVQDIMVFTDKKFVSENYKKKGYEPTNYSLSVSESDETSFGTMQIKDKETIFWKGTILAETIDGSIHVQRPGGDNMTYYYNGKLASGVLVRKGEAKPVPPPAPVPDPVVVPEAPVVSQEPVPQPIVPIEPAFEVEPQLEPVPEEGEVNHQGAVDSQMMINQGNAASQESLSDSKEPKTTELTQVQAEGSQFESTAANKTDDSQLQVNSEKPHSSMDWGWLKGKWRK